jgi:hypothetical protein
MRIIGNIEHPQFKVTVFRMDGRTTLKYESPLYEVSFKLGEDERFSNLEGVQKWAHSGLNERIAAIFQQMHQLFLETQVAAFPEDGAENFDEIV